MNEQFNNLPIRPVRPVGPVDATRPAVRPEIPKESFEKVLSTELSKQNLNVTFSAHAMNRLRLNRTELSPVQLQKIGSAIDRAQGKGSREALLLMDDMAMVASVKNRTIITVVDGARMKENIFTNIDSAVIL